MKALNVTKPTTTPAAKPVTTDKHGNTADKATVVPNTPKNPLQRAFAASANAKRAIDRLAKITAGWRPEGPHSAALSAFRKTIEDMVVDSGSAVEQVTNLAVNKYSPPAGRGGGSRAAVKVGARIQIRPLLLQRRFAFLDEAQRTHLYVDREEVDPKGKGSVYLVVCRQPGAPSWPVGLMRAGAFAAVEPVAGG